MLVTPDTAKRLLGALERPSARHEVDLQDLVAELEHVAAQPNGTLADAELGRVPGAGDGRGPGVTPFDPRYRTVIVEELGAVAMVLAPRGERAVYLELKGRINKSQNHDEGAYLFSIGQAAELLASLVVAGQAGGAKFASELEPAIAREQARRGLNLRA